MKGTWKLDTRDPCTNWQEEGDTGHCTNCGGQQIAHEPWLTQAFDLMAKAP